MASLPTYTRANVTSLILALPLDAFVSKDWAGHRRRACGARAHADRLRARQRGRRNARGTGPWMNGALTIQLVKATTPDSAVELNMPGDPAMGYRLKKDVTVAVQPARAVDDLLAPPEQEVLRRRGLGQESAAGLRTVRTAAASAGAPGSDDPKDGLVRQRLAARRPAAAAAAARSPGRARRSPTPSPNGSSVTQTTTLNADGSITVTRDLFVRGNRVVHDPTELRRARQSDTRAKTGRVSWREMIRP